MVHLERSIQLLLATRGGLLDQIDAIDRAVAALRGEATLPTATQAKPSAVAAVSTPEVVVQKVRPRRVLSDEHRQKLADGRRKAREAKGVVSGDVRESVGDTFVPALAVTVDETPRLVKRSPARELTVVPDEQTADALEAVLT
jgi:hypothetical protein